MENTVTGLNERPNVAELAELAIKTINNIKENCQENGYQINEDKLKVYLENEDLIRERILKIGKTQQKKLFRAIKKVYNKSTIRSFNSFFHVLHWIVAHELVKHGYSYWQYWSHKVRENNIFDKVKVLPPQKEVDIQKRREEMKFHREKYLKALEDYKTEKGDYYKTRQTTKITLS